MAKNTYIVDGVSANLKKLQGSAIYKDWGRKASAQLLVLSRRQVPFMEGGLQRSGFADDDAEGYFVAYNEEYAAYQHEGMRADGTHVVRNWNNGRKSKYLEDPMKENIREWLKMAGGAMQGELKKKL